MKFCTNCGEGLEDNIQICPKCGMQLGATGQNDAAMNQADPGVAPQGSQGPQGPQGFQPQPPFMGGQPGMYQQPIYNYDPTDHTAEMDPKDIMDNKTLAVAAYILSFMGIIIALLAAKDSRFVGFHVRQLLKLHVLIILIYFISLILCWTIIVPIIGGICELVLFVVHIIGFVNTCKGKAKEMPIINSFKFM